MKDWFSRGSHSNEKLVGLVSNSKKHQENKGKFLFSN